MDATASKLAKPQHISAIKHPERGSKFAEHLANYKHFSKIIIHKMTIFTIPTKKGQWLLGLEEIDIFKRLTINYGNILNERISPIINPIYNRMNLIKDNEQIGEISDDIPC